MVSSTTRHFIPALLAAVAPNTESSITKASLGFISNFSQAFKNISGAGLPFYTSSPKTNVSK